MTERRHSRPGNRPVKGEEPDPTTDAGLLLQAIREGADTEGAWYLVAGDVGGGWWLRDASRPLRELTRRGLVEDAQESTSIWRRSIWARALTAEELGQLRCVCDGYALSMGGPHDPQCPTHGRNGTETRR